MTVHNDYPCNTANYRKGRKSAVKYLVVHYVGATGNAKNNAKYYATTAGIGASAHYFVGHAPEAEIWSSVAEGDTAWHCGANQYVHPECRNDNAIGVELCCHKNADGTWYFDGETIDAAIELCRDIVSRYGIDAEHVIRHYDVTGKVCPEPFVREWNAWEAFKNQIFAEGEIDMTKEEVVSLIQTQVNEAVQTLSEQIVQAAQEVKDEVTPAVYNTADACPEWARKAVRWAVDSGYIVGDEEGRLRLDASKLWGLQVMYNVMGGEVKDASASGSGGASSKPTVPVASVDDWALEAWDSAAAQGVLDGTRPKDAITRQELALVLDRLGLLGV